jgi:hypothetical protein
MKWWEWIILLVVGLAIYNIKYGLIVGVSSRNLLWGNAVGLLLVISMMVVQGIKKRMENREIPDARDQKKE